MKNKLVISLLAVLALVLGGFAYLMSAGYLSKENVVGNTKITKELTQVETVSESDNLDDIEKDLDDTDLENVDAEMTQIEAELDASLNDL